MDWSHPDWRYDVKTPEDSAAFSRFLTFTDNQLKELATLYPTVKDFWFDGTWDASIKKNGWWTAHVERMLKEMLPGVTSTAVCVPMTTGNVILTATVI